MVEDNQILLPKLKSPTAAAGDDGPLFLSHCVVVVVVVCRKKSAKLHVYRWMTSSSLQRGCLKRLTHARAARVPILVDDG
jgi:hypothetical protein